MTEFTVGPYTIRFSNKNVSVRDDLRYSKLDAVGRHDSFELFRSFFEANVDNFKNLPESKTVFRFQNLEFEPDTRKISGHFCVGTYGMLSDIINTDSGQVDFTKATNHAEIINYYFCIYVPINADEGVLLIQSIRGNGVKTLFHRIISEYVNRICSHNVQMNPLAYEQSFENWKDAIARDITLVKFNPVSDPADTLNYLGHREVQTNLVIKVARKANGGLGTLQDFCDPHSEATRAIEILKRDCLEVKATFVDSSNRTRTFNISTPTTHPICEIDVPDTVDVIDGNVEINSMRAWCNEIVDDFSSRIIRD